MQIDGNMWRVSSLGKAMLAGMLTSLIPILALFFFNDNRSLGMESEAHTAARPGTEGTILHRGDILHNISNITQQDTPGMPPLSGWNLPLACCAKQALLRLANCYKIQSTA